MPSPIRSIAAGAVLLVLATVAGAAQSVGPLTTVKQASDRIIAILSDASVPRAERWTHIAPVIAEGFDFRAMSMSILTNQWESATLAEQQQFVDYFSQYIEGTYRSKIEAYSGQRIEYTDEKIRGERASVNSIIHADAVRIPVNYYLRQNDKGEWKAYDVSIEGISLINSYRETYAAIARTSGIGGVLAHVKRRAGEAAWKVPANLDP